MLYTISYALIIRAMNYSTHGKKFKFKEVLLKAKSMAILEHPVAMQPKGMFWKCQMKQKNS